MCVTFNPQVKSKTNSRVSEILVVNTSFRLFFEIVVKDDERENQTMETKDCGGTPVFYLKKKEAKIASIQKCN